MVSFLYTDLVSGLKPLSLGLYTLYTEPDEIPILIVKATKEVILSAKLKRGFSIHVAPIILAREETIGLISEFGEDFENPLVIQTPLFLDNLSKSLINLLLHSKIKISFFDDNSRELLSYNAKVICPPLAKERLKHSKLERMDTQFSKDPKQVLEKWFSYFSEFDYPNSIFIELQDSVIKEGTIFHYVGAPELPTTTSLVRPEPGEMQEQDIYMHLSKTLKESSIFIGPLRSDNNEELTDLLVLSKTSILFIQAKDTPNTEKSLSAEIDKKRRKAIKHLKKAVRQTEGCIKYARKNANLTFYKKQFENRKVYNIHLDGKSAYALIIIEETFIQDLAIYSKMIEDLQSRINTPCIVLSYLEFIEMIKTHPSEFEFYNALKISG